MIDRELREVVREGGEDREDREIVTQEETCWLQTLLHSTFTRGSVVTMIIKST